MAKISSYTTVTPPALTDRVIGTDSVGTPTDSTKNFLIGDIVGLVTTPDLSAVLTAGNSATNDIVLTGNITAVNTTLSGTLTAVNTTLSGTLTAVNATLSGTLGVTGESTFSGNVVLSSTLTAGGTSGAAGQILQSTGIGAQWITYDLQAVLAVGASSTLSMTLGGTATLTTYAATVGSGGITLTGPFSANFGVGTAGQVLTSQGAGVSPQWLGVSVPVPTITQVLNAGDNAGGNDITFLNSISTDNIVASGAVGVLGQLMQSTGGGITWVSSVNLTTVETDNLIISGGTITADGVTGAAGEVLKSTVTGVEWGAAGGGLTWILKAANYIAVDGDMVGANTNLAFTVSPPSTPSAGMKFGVQDIRNSASGGNTTINFNTVGTKWNGTASDLVLSKDSFCVVFEYINATYGWALVGGAIP